MKEKIQEQGVSPVVGVMLMLVVVIIIAAIVSAFAGSAVSTQKKVPQATITATYSISNGLSISHVGGDPLPTNDLTFTIRDNPVFGPNLEMLSAQVLNKSAIVNSKGESLSVYGEGTSNITAFVSGDILYMNAADTSCDLMQPAITPSDYHSYQTGIAYGGNKPSFWRLCIRNPDNAGKSFALEVSDKRGSLISKTDVTIAG